MYLQNAWYQVAWAHDVPQGASLTRTILNEPLLICRDAQGAPVALHDMCPHRFAPLSKGVVEGGVVKCGYHGLAFNGRGECVANPHGAIPKAAKVRSFPVQEKHLALWVWMGNPEVADPGLIPDLSFIDTCPEAGRVFGYLPTKADYRLVIDNIMDLSHADYLHASTLGGIMTDAEFKLEQRGEDIFVAWEARAVKPPPAFAAMVNHADRADIWVEVLWRAPGVMVLGTGADQVGAGRTIEHSGHTLHNAVPETSTSCHYFYCSTRAFLLTPEFSEILKSTLDQAFNGEDKPMLEAQQARMGDRDFWSLRPNLLSIDAGSVRVRRLLEGRIAQAAQ